MALTRQSNQTEEDDVKGTWYRWRGFKDEESRQYGLRGRNRWVVEDAVRDERMRGADGREKRVGGNTVDRRSGIGSGQGRRVATRKQWVVAEVAMLRPR